MSCASRDDWETFISWLEQEIAFRGIEQITRFCRQNEVDDVNKPDRRGKSALCLAAARGALDSVRFLLSFGADVNKRDATGNGPIHCAVTRGHAQVTEELIHAGADLGLSDQKGRQPLVLAAMGRSSNTSGCGQILIDHGADVNAVNENGMSPLMLASQTGNDALVKALLKVGADVEQESKDKTTALMFASSEGRLEVLRCLIEAGANVNRVNSRGLSALMFASKGAHANIVSALLSNEADVHTVSKFRMESALMLAPADNATIVKLLCEHGALVNQKNDFNKSTPLFKVINSFGATSCETLLCLIRHGADVNAENWEGDTPLMSAIKLQKQDVVKYLLSVGASMACPRSKFRNALTYAAAYGSEDMIQHLLHSGADLNGTDDFGSSALICAIKHSSNLQTAHSLLDYGAAVNIQNRKGETALLCACARQGTEHLIKQLVALGADVTLTDENGGTALYHALRNNIHEHGILHALLANHATVTFELHEAVLQGDAGVVRFMVQNGAGPGLADPSQLSAKPYDLFIPYPVTPLFVALMEERLDVLELFTSLCFFHEFDLVKLPRITQLREYLATKLRTKSLKYLDELFSQPWSLRTQCLVRVSTAIGTQQGREQRLYKAGLPNILRQKLMYRVEGTAQRS